MIQSAFCLDRKLLLVILIMKICNKTFPYFLGLFVMLSRYGTIILSLLIVLGVYGSAFAGWTPAERISDETTAYSPRIVAKGDTLHVAYWMWVYYNESYYLRSIDGGYTWTEPYLLADTSLTSSNVVPIIKVKNNNVFIVWSNYFRGGGGRNITFRKSTNSGQNWQSPVYILPSNNLELQKHAMCISDSDIYVVFSHNDNGLHFEFTKSTNWGQTWSEPEEIFTTLESGDIDIACRGDAIHFVWIGRFNYDDKWETYYIKSENSGIIWSENMLLSTFDDDGGNFPSISINETGNIAIIWMDYKYSPYFITGDILVRYSYDSGDNWTEEEQLTFTHKVWSQRVLWHSDSIHVVWQDERYDQEDIFYMLSTDNGLSWGEEQRVDDDPARSEQSDIAVSGENRFIVWNDRRSDPGPGVYLSCWEPEVSIEEKNNNIPEDIFLQAYPNPFNSKTIISCSNLRGGEIDIYNISGQLVKKLNISDDKEGKVTWDATDAFGETVSSGIYFVKARVGENKGTIKLIYLK